MWEEPVSTPPRSQYAWSDLYVVDVIDELLETPAITDLGPVGLACPGESQQ